MREDWRAWLPEDKAHIFYRFVDEFEVSYSVVSVSLDDAFSLRNRSLLDECRTSAAVTAEISSLLFGPLVAMLRALGAHARHYGTTPNASPLDPENYRGARSQRAARFHSLLSHCLLSQRSQFLYKIHVLLEMVENIQKDLGEALALVADGPCASEPRIWAELDALHFDLNTCLRETIVLLKSFLHVVPDVEIPGFERQARQLPPRDVHSRSRDIRHRRPAIIESE